MEVITRIRGLLAIGAASLILVGCTTEPVEEPITMEETPAPTEVVEPTPVKDTGPQKPTIDLSKRITVYSSSDDGGETLQGIFYFDFDQAIVKRSGHSELDKHASALKQNNALRVRLEGHADERGTREYNLALGEKRANAIRAYMASQGVSRYQVEVVSYGEEKPAVTGSGESSWAQNRRVEFKYK